MITPAVTDSLAAAARENYIVKACGFLRAQFPRQTKDVSDQTLAATARLAFQHSQMRGYTKTRDHLKYLIPVVYWGSYFETDPQHRAALIRADWIAQDGRAKQQPSLGQLTIEIDAHTDATRSDTATLETPVSAFQAHFEQNNSRDDGPACLQLMTSTFPAHVAYMTDADMRDFVRMALTQGKTRNLFGCDLVAYVALALKFGTHFGIDPLHDWVHPAYMDTSLSSDEHRLLLGKGMTTYLLRFEIAEEDA
ncbi:hypothetical protein MWU61_17940 [Loktanella sp. F6476L]|uniref:hypothetical protein n=1 Tax=Loktanella sp. F6476L TaxID=2926405 RepID=UPI001FF661E9|nr:hypothetical protein [Loktanella sp. F6476L]MCK0122442.1 hypothetical protein [Loktanella sp. F6476L]